MSKEQEEEVKPVVVHEWCGTQMRDGRIGCPRGPACAAESVEWARVVRLDDMARRHETARTIVGR